MAKGKGISAEAQQLVKMFVPLALAGGIGFIAWQRKSSWQMVLILIAGGYILSRIFIGNLFNIITTITTKPQQVDIAPGALPGNFNAKQWADQLHDDIYSWGMRNNDLYDDLVRMSDSQLAAIGNAWLQHYYAKDNESLSRAMKGENYGNDWFDNTAANAKLIIDKLQAMGL